MTSHVSETTRRSWFSGRLEDDQDGSAGWRSEGQCKGHSSESTKSQRVTDRLNTARDYAQEEACPYISVLRCGGRSGRRGRSPEVLRPLRPFRPSWPEWPEALGEKRLRPLRPRSRDVSLCRVEFWRVPALVVMHKDHWLPHPVWPLFVTGVSKG